MNKPKDHYPRAIIPEHLTKLTIDTLPLDTPYYINPGERDDYEPPAVFVDHDRRLRMSRSFSIDPADALKHTAPIGRVGIVRSAIFSDNTVRDVYLADLRMIESHSLVDSGDASSMSLDQEEYMHYAAEMANSIVFDGLIVAEARDMEYQDIPAGIFYGHEALHPALKALGKRTKKLVKYAIRASEQAAKDRAAEEAATQAKEKQKQPQQP